MANLKALRAYVHDLIVALGRIGRATTDHGYIPRKAMFIGAHPDDPEHFCAGTVALWAKGGAEIRYVLCTSGEMGTKDLSIDPEELMLIREREQLAAAEVVGVKDVVFLRNKDGLLENNISLRRQLVHEIRSFKPEVVIICDPSLLFTDEFIEHPDHRAAANAALGAVYPSSGSPHLFRELEGRVLAAHEVRKLYVYTWQKPNTWINITSTIDLKISAHKKHVSQIGDTDPSQIIRDSAARSARFMRMKYAETFRVITLDINDD